MTGKMRLLTFLNRFDKDYLSSPILPEFLRKLKKIYPNSVL